VRTPAFRTRKTRRLSHGKVPRPLLFVRRKIPNSTIPTTHVAAAATLRRLAKGELTLRHEASQRAAATANNQKLPESPCLLVSSLSRSSVYSISDGAEKQCINSRSDHVNSPRKAEPVACDADRQHAEKEPSDAEQPFS